MPDKHMGSVLNGIQVLGPPKLLSEPLKRTPLGPRPSYLEPLILQEPSDNPRRKLMKLYHPLKKKHPKP